MLHRTQRERELEHALGLRRKLGAASRTIAELREIIEERTQEAADAAVHTSSSAFRHLEQERDRLSAQLERETQRAESAGASTCACCRSLLSSDVYVSGFDEVFCIFSHATYVLLHRKCKTAGNVPSAAVRCTHVHLPACSNTHYTHLARIYMHTIICFV